MAGLNERQKKFCDEYLIDLNATQAAKRAGYSERTAYSAGDRLLKKTEVAQYIEKRKNARIKRTEITQDFVLTELMKIATSDGSDFLTVEKKNRLVAIPTADLMPEKRAAIASIKKNKFGIEVKPYDKLKALELLGKHLGMFGEKGNGSSEEAETGVVVMPELLSEDKDDDNE